LKPLRTVHERNAMIDGADSLPVAFLFFKRWDTQKLIDRFFRIVDLHLLGIVVLVLDVDISALIFVFVFVFKIVATPLSVS